MKRILILNGGYSEIPLIRAAKQKGFSVAVTGNNRSAPGNALADEYIPCDYSDREAVCRLAEEKGVEAVCSACNDLAYLSAAYTCEMLGLPGHDSYETAKKLHHKHHFRRWMQDNGLPAPRSLECVGMADLDQLYSLHFPVMVKPVDLFGGMGMQKCDTPDQVREAVQAAHGESRLQTVLVEEFLEGSNHGFTAMIQNKKVVFSMADQEYHDYSPFAVSAASVPANLPEGAVASLKAQLEAIAEGMQLCDGLVHAQFILTRQQVPVILEICRRSPGDLYIDFVKYATGMDYPERILSFEAGLEVEPIRQQEATGCWVRHVLACTREGILNDIILKDELQPYIREKAIYFERGKEVAAGQIYKAGVLFLQFCHQEEMEQMMGRIHNLVEYDCSSGTERRNGIYGNKD